MPKAAQTGDVAATATVKEPRSLSKIRTSLKRFDKPRDLGGISRAVSINQSHDVAGCSSNSTGDSVSFTHAGLPKDAHIWPMLPSDGNGAINREAIHEDHLMDILRYAFKDVWYIARLVQRWNNDRN